MGHRTPEQELELLQEMVKRLRRQIYALLKVIELKESKDAGPRSIEEDQDRAAFPILDHIYRP